MKQTERIIVNIEWVDKEAFHPLATGVELSFPDDVACRPLPKTWRAMEALEAQHPEIFAKIPTFKDERGFEFQRGVCFTTP